MAAASATAAVERIFPGLAEGKDEAGGENESAQGLQFKRFVILSDLRLICHHISVFFLCVSCVGGKRERGRECEGEEEGEQGRKVSLLAVDLPG